MDTVPGLRQLQARKRELILESELNRQSLRVECGRIRYRAEQFRRGYGWANSAWKWAVPVAGFLLARKFKTTAGIFAKGSLLAGVLRSAWRFWDTLRERQPGTDPSDPTQDRSN